MKHAITLQQIRDRGPCREGWAKLVRALGYANGSYDPSRTVTLGDIAKSNGPEDALWCARCLPEEAHKDLIRAILPSVKRASKYTTDQRVTKCIETVDQWLSGTPVDLAEAARAARAAAWAEAAWAAEAAAAAWAARAAWAAERALQEDDIIAVFGASSYELIPAS